MRVVALELHVTGKHRVVRERENTACYIENARARERDSMQERERQQARERDSKLVSLDQLVNMSIASIEPSPFTELQEPLKSETSVTIGPLQ
jgi:hypothetical protein